MPATIPPPAHPYSPAPPPPPPPPQPSLAGCRSAPGQVLKCGKYRDVLENPNECATSKVDYDASNRFMQNRQTVYCVPIPGETPWVKGANAQSAAAAGPEAAVPDGRANKRSFDDYEEEMADEDSSAPTPAAPGGAVAPAREDSDERKRIQTAQHTSAGAWGAC